MLLPELTRHHTPNTRSMKAGEHRQPAYLEINPLGKVPATRTAMHS